MNLNQIGKFIAGLRKDKKMTQAELGEKLGVTNKTVSRHKPDGGADVAQRKLGNTKFYIVCLTGLTPTTPL
ncbi:helix-turn-helix domain-containing protein [Enterocloster clostridioformis]|uniref:helix-turn-helix domain-containing protein n=1 Tax=Enterocloster clostridioformis TaxID=1531 RepID=UPI000408E007|nr:helix-turn-helix transcriptional regulator [Enterocloster clostridioformis]